MALAMAPIGILRNENSTSGPPMSDAIEQPDKHTKSTTVLVQPLYHSTHQPERSRNKLLRQSWVAVPLQRLCWYAHCSHQKDPDRVPPPLCTGWSPEKSPDFLTEHFDHRLLQIHLKMPQNFTTNTNSTALFESNKTPGHPPETHTTEYRIEKKELLLHLHHSI